MPAATLPGEVRASAAVIAARASAVRIDHVRMQALNWPVAAPAPALDPERHYLESSRLPARTASRYGRPCCVVSTATRAPARRRFR